MSSKLNKEILKIFEILSKNKKLNYFKDSIVSLENREGELLKITDQDITSPISELITTLVSKPSPLPNQSPDYELLNSLIEELTKQESVRGLNHIGFLYHVESLDQEKARLMSKMKTSSFKLYEEPSNEKAKWYFIGDTTSWDQPMIEMVPVESNGDTFIDYWLPHIHIDIDTNMDENQIESLFYKVYDGDPKPYRAVVIDEIVFVIRLRLGIIDGVNLFIDLSTNHRDVKKLRQNSYKQLSN